jgi:hypothetical protein
MSKEKIKPKDKEELVSIIKKSVMKKGGNVSKVKYMTEMFENSIKIFQIGV